MSPQRGIAVLVHSPFLGPASLRPLATALTARAQPTILLDLRPSVVSAPVHQVLVGAFADAIGTVVEEAEGAGRLVLVGHSGAGPLLPAFADALEDSVAGLVFVDAGLPTPGRSWRDTVGPERYTPLRDRSRDGLLPRWHLWWDHDPLPALVTDPALRAELVEEFPEVPLGILKEARPDVEWTGPAGYLALSAASAGDLETARAMGWPVRVLDTHHLAPATDPDPVAGTLLDLLAELLG